MLGVILGVGTFLIFICAGLAFYMLRGAKRNIPKERLKELRLLGKEQKKQARSGSFEQEQLEKPFFERIIQPILEGQAKRFKGKKDKTDPIAELLIRAGNPGNMTSAQFKALQFLMFVVLFTLGLGMTLLTPFGIVFGAVGAGFAFILPKFYLSKLVTKRQKGMKKMLPDVLDLLTVSVEAGLGFDQALQKVVEKLKGPLTEEFDRMLQEVKIGKSRKDALKAVAARAQFQELDSLVSAVIQADTLGVSIGQILRIQSEQLRVKRRQAIEEMAQKLPIKMLFPMIFFIFPTIFIVTLGPIALKVMASMAGET